VDRTAPAPPRWARGGDRAARRRRWPADLVERQLRHTKDEPRDFDACWDTDDVDLDALDAVLLDLSNHRAAQKSRFGGELFPNVVETQSGLSFAEFFQNERDTSRKSIVVIHLSQGDAS
jgi:hypothetical protein